MNADNVCYILIASEQRITPWQDDASASKCPMCTASFHPLTNRKHHCRLCGQIICSLPIKHPQRPQPCSLLFVVDPKTRKIEEVGEGVDYGVKRRRTASISAPPGKTAIQEELDESEKFLKGVRICRGCKPILMSVPSRLGQYSQLRTILGDNNINKKCRWCRRSLTFMQ